MVRLPIACTVPGTEVLRATLLNPLFLTPLASTLIVAILVAKKPRLFVKSARAATAVRWFVIATLIAAYGIVVYAATWSTTPGVDYGIVVEDGVARVTFIDHKSVELSVCNATVKLLDYREAVSLLERRDFGLGDPFTKTHMGYYTGRDGRGYKVAIIMGAPKVLYIDDGRERVLVGVQGVEECYRAILEACGAQPPPYNITTQP